MKNTLRELRAAKGWSQGDLGQVLGVSRQTINALETEKYDPSLPLAFQIARLFECSIEDIFSDGKSSRRSKPKPAATEVSTAGTSPWPELPTHIL